MTMTNKTINTRTRFHQKMVAAALMLAALCPVLWTQPAAAGGDASLADTVRQAVESDRSGACLAVAIIDKGVDDVDIEQAFVCADAGNEDRKSTRLNSSHVAKSYAVFCLKKKKIISQPN